MSQYKYAIVKMDEDGESLHYLNHSEENDINLLMENYGIEKWVEKYDDPAYWEQGEAMLVKVQCINPRPIKVVTDWELPQ